MPDLPRPRLILSLAKIGKPPWTCRRCLGCAVDDDARTTGEPPPCPACLGTGARPGTSEFHARRAVMLTATCPACGAHLDPREFYRDASRRDVCYPCAVASDREPAS
jgi:hypothetical protein